MLLAFRHMALLLIVLYLFIPVMGFAHVDVPDVGATAVRLVDGALGSPCDHCPCSDGQGSRCCDAAYCSCAFHSPPDQGFQVSYAPIMIITRNSESFWMLPQVYRPIFVPPQNRFMADCLMLLKMNTIAMSLEVV
jgi:hypothetical protein